MRTELSDKLSGLKERVGDILKTGAKVVAGGVVGGYILFSLASHNGMLDSARTKEARQLRGEQVKTVATVDEEWKDTQVYSPTMDGYNPQVIREVTFEDGSQTTLKYRTLAWQPFMKWKNGEQFEPKQGEQYEVTSANIIVRKVR